MGLYSIKMKQTKGADGKKAWNAPPQRAGGWWEPAWESMRILAPEPPPRTAARSRGGREIPLPIKALLEAGERPRATWGGIRVVPRMLYAPDDLQSGAFLFPPHEPKEDSL